ncbi:MAG: efflux RND transporter permease subunit [Deltaproteobacteria bacterium]|nr:efflux RND transporter permease subunit [Deltaproteobacteria bacterium]
MSEAVRLQQRRWSLPRFALNNPHVTIVMSLLMIGLGVYSFLTIPQRMVPKIPTPNIGVVTKFPGMSAEDMERYITRPLEKKIQIVGGINFVLGVSQAGYSKIVVYFDYDVDLPQKRAEMKSLLDTIVNELPRAGANTTAPRLIHVDRQNVPLIQFAVRREGVDRTALKEMLNNVILTQFQKIDGVLAASIFGGPDRQIQVVVDRDRIQAYGLSVLGIRKAIDTANLDRGGGPLIDGGNQIEVRIPSEFKEKELMRRLPELPVGSYKERIVYLKDVAEVRDTFAQMYGDFIYNGEPAIWLGVQAEPLRDFITVADEAKKLTSLLEQEYPGLRFDVVFDKTFYIGLNDKNATRQFFLAVVLASLVMLLFLGELGGSFIAAAILPSTVAFGFFLIHMMGFQRDFGIMLGLVFVVGKLVDNSVVVVEVIRRYIERGVHPRIAAVRGTEEVQKAMTGATFAFLIMLIPMTQMTGDMGSGFRSMTIPMITTVIASLLMALTLTPLMAAYLLKPRPGAIEDEDQLDRVDTAESMAPTYEAPPGWIGKIIYHIFLRYYFIFERFFGRVIGWAITYKWIVVTATAVLIWSTFVIYDTLDQEQMPLTDTSLLLGYVRARPGTSFERMKEIVTAIEKIALKQKSVKNASALVGKSSVWGQYFTGYGVNTVNEARTIMNLTIARKERKETLWDIQAAIEKEARATIPDLDVLFFQPIAPTPVAAARAPVEILVKGPELDQVYAYGNQILEMAKTQSRGLHSPYLDKDYGVPQLSVEVDKPRARAMGLTVQDVVGQVYYAINGGFTNTFFNPEPMLYHSRILIRYREDRRSTPDDLEDLKIATPSGKMVPLKSLARIRRTVGYDRIHTYDTLYAASVLGYYKELGLKETTMSLMMPAKMQLSLPRGYAVGPAGLMGTMLRAFNELQMGLKIALLGLYLLLVIQFRSFAIGLVLMLAIPLQGVGSLGALYLRGMAWSPPVLWGMVLLAGVVISNSILVVDQIIHLRGLGMEREEAVRTASMLRLRPVLMTTITTVIAILPVAINPPPATEQFRNIATGISGGLITSTIMTLIAIPVAYLLMDDIVTWVRRFYLDERFTLKQTENP